jgi:hypothetical protein
MMRSRILLLQKRTTLKMKKKLLLKGYQTINKPKPVSHPRDSH